MTQKEWEETLSKLNDKINSLEVWDSYAERLQSRYDELLTENPRLEVNLKEKYEQSK